VPPREEPSLPARPPAAWITFGALAVLAAAILAVVAINGLDRRLLSLTTQDVESFAEAWGAWSAAASIVLMVLHSFMPLPAEMIAIANGMLFGPVWGIVVTWVGAMLGAALAFAFARGIGRPIARRLVSERRWRAIESWSAHPSTLLLVRLIPVISFNLVNYAAGVTGIGWWTFLWTTGLGILPITAASVIFGDRMMSITWPVWLLIAAGVLVLWGVWRVVLAPRFTALRPSDD
jgi:uncharacterized membrane protein YdjX (TVP38/TMEM64 family)